MRALVWVDAWQQECCGDDFAVGAVPGLYPEPRSAVLVDLVRVEGVESVPTGEQLNGYVVELELEAAK